MMDGKTERNDSGAGQGTETFAHTEAVIDPLLGQMAGNYHLLARAGEGGFGSVYRARDVRLDRLAAVKFLRVGDSPQAKAQFEREARALAKLGRHPGVVDVYAWGELAGKYYIAMEFVPHSVADLLAQFPKGMPVETALAITLQCAQALAEAHETGILHGDIKPSNILLDGPPESAKLCDFGLTQLGPDPHTRALSGSPAFMAPERAQGGPLTEACDLFALGATLAAMLTGGALIEAASLGEALKKAAAGRRIDVRAIRPDLPKRVAGIVEKATAQNVSNRYHNAREFAEDLRSACEPGAAKEQKPRPVRWMARIAAGLALLAAAVIAVVISGELASLSGDSTVVLADARVHLNEGDYKTAREGFEGYLNEHPEDAEARYGLAYAFLLEGDQQRAAEEFARVGEVGLRTEGQAAVAYMKDGEQARPAIEKAESQAHGGYVEVMLAMLDVMSNDFPKASERLAKVSEAQFPFDWQRRQYLQTLGQVQFKQGNFAQAQETFDKLSQQSSGNAPAVATLASDYAELSRRQAESSQREEVSAQVARLKTLLAQAPATPEADTWSSRPLRLWIPPVSVHNGVIAQETGLADVLPWRLSRVLLEDSSAPVVPVERGATAQILAEQELASQLGGDNAVQLGKVLGARLMLQTEVTRLFQDESLNVSLVDTETTRLVPVGEYKITRDIDPTAWVGGIVADLKEAVAKTYPLRGKVTRSGGAAVLNIGTEAGVLPEMVFQAYAGPGEGFALKGVTLKAGAMIEPNQTPVTIEGADPASIPAGGWFAQHMRNARDTVHAPS